MKKIAILVLALLLAGTACYAAEKVAKATEPFGAVIEAGGVFVGKIVGSVEQATTGETKITVRSEDGETRVFPFAETVKIVDTTFNAVTLNQLKAGEKVAVQYKKEGGVQKADAVTVAK